MRILVYEHVSAGGVAGLPPSVAREGRAMLEAVLADLAAIDGVEVDAILDERLEPFALPASSRFHGSVGPRDAGNGLDDLARAADGVLLIAPELRAAAGLVRDVMLLGMGSHFELWDAQRHAEHEAAVMASPMPDSLKQFAF